MSDAAHAPYAPSSMERLELCPGSFRACAGISVESGPWAADGTEAHTTLAWCLENGIRKLALSDDAMTATELQIRNWTHRTDTREERIKAVQVALDYVYGIIDMHDDAEVFIEKRVHVDSVFTKDIWGTADILIYAPSMQWLYVPDYKHGSGKFVSGRDNIQTGCYAVGAYDSLNEGFVIKEIITAIIQPRIDWADEVVREETKSAEYYDTVVRERINEIVSNTMVADAPLVPGEIQCQFCPIKTSCIARQQAALQTARLTLKDVRDFSTAKLPPVNELTPEYIAFVLASADILRGWLKDVERLAHEKMLGGTSIPGHKLVHTQARRQWEGDEDATAEALMFATGLPKDAVYPRKLVGITEAEKLVVNAFKMAQPDNKNAAKEAREFFAEFTTKQSSGALTVVTSDDRRPAVDVARVFANVNPIPKAIT